MRTVSRRTAGASWIFTTCFPRPMRRGGGTAVCDCGADARFLYRTVTDLLNGAAKKFLRGEVLPEDDYSQGGAELELFVEMTLDYLRGGKNKLGEETQ
jgi:hypothetical protein